MPQPPDLSQLERLLIVKLSSIGDVIHALPVSAALGEAFPHLQLTWLVEETAAPLVRHNPYLTDVIVLPDYQQWSVTPKGIKRFFSFGQELRARRFDVALDLQGLTRSAFLTWMAGAPQRFGWDWLRELATFFVTRVPRQKRSVHVVDQLLDVARFLGATPHEVKFPLVIPDEEDNRAVELLQEVQTAPSQPFLAINPTGERVQKGWGLERLVGLLDALARGMDLPVVLIGGPGDHAIGRAIQVLTRKPPANLIGRTNLLQLAAILRRAAVHLGGDTGSVHLAAALGTRVVAVYGRTNPVRLAPYGQETGVVQHRERCAPVCRRHHQGGLNSSQKCFVLPPACLAAVTEEEVAAAIKDQLNHPSSSPRQRLALAASHLIGHC